jgi:hypothetical protein
VIEWLALGIELLAVAVIVSAVIILAVAERCAGLLALAKKG